MRVHLVQALALVALLQAVGPLVEPPEASPGRLAGHYGETVQLSGRVRSVEPGDEVTRVEVAAGGSSATVLTRARPPPLGARVEVRGQASPGREGPVLWAEGELAAEADPEGPVDLARARKHAPRWAGAPLAVAGSWPENGSALVGPGGRLPVEAVGIQPRPGPVVLWGRLAYEAERAAYQLEATGWRPWRPPPG